MQKPSFSIDHEVNIDKAIEEEPSPLAQDCVSAITGNLHLTNIDAQIQSYASLLLPPQYLKDKLPSRSLTQNIDYRTQ